MELFKNDSREVLSLRKFIMIAFFMLFGMNHSGAVSNNLSQMMLQANSQKVVYIPAVGSLDRLLQEALIVAKPGTTIVLPGGIYEFEDEVINAKSHITIRGQGMDKTILNFKNQKAGAQGILAVGDAFILEDLTIRDTKGDGIKIEGVDSTILRRVKIEWTGGSKTSNGPYGFYPVQCSNVLIEDSVVIGASDSGIYVGQSHHIIVRRNEAYGNVAGIEIENSTYADVYDNDVHHNTTGILVFDLPNLKVQGGKRTRVFHNKVYRNNLRNFATKGNIVRIVPAGTGIMIMANDDVEVFENKIFYNKLVSVAVINYEVTEIPISDPNYDPMPEKIYIHDNIMDKRRISFYDGDRFNFLVHSLFMFRVPQIIIDGIGDGSYSGSVASDEDKICIQNNRTSSGNLATFGNMHLDHQRRFNPFPGGPVTRSWKSHDCTHPSIAPVTFTPWPKLPDQTPPSHTPEEVTALCKSKGSGVNWKAFVVDCPELSDYRLFQSSSNPTTLPESGGYYYDLTTPLFSDYALKDRFFFVPPGQKIDYSPDKVLNFPIGTFITKTFSFAPDLRKPNKGKYWLETRLLIRRKEGWVALPYSWKINKEGEDDHHLTASLSLAGDVTNVTFTGHDGKKQTNAYSIPGVNKCTRCHEGAGGDIPIGPKAKWLNRSNRELGEHANQLLHWKEVGLLVNLPDDFAKAPRAPVWNDELDGNVEDRAKAYLDINCSHCHNPVGRARFSGLFLEFERESSSVSYGYCKAPVAAGVGSGGLSYDLVPRQPYKSIIHYRMNSIHPSVRMPELARSIVHREGVELIKNWIKDLDFENCEKINP